MNHSFNVELAKELGVLAATIFNNLAMRYMIEGFSNTKETK